MTTAEAMTQELSQDDKEFLAKEAKRHQLAGLVLQAAGEATEGKLDGYDLYYLMLEAAARAYLVKRPLTRRFSPEVERMAQEIEWGLQFSEEAKEAMGFQIIHKCRNFFA